jgi:hypothetical protein
MTTDAVRLGALCKRGHDNGHGYSVRYVSNGGCVKCVKHWNDEYGAPRTLEPDRASAYGAWLNEHDDPYAYLEPVYIDDLLLEIRRYGSITPLTIQAA